MESSGVGLRNKGLFTKCLRTTPNGSKRLQATPTPTPGGSSGSILLESDQSRGCAPESTSLHYTHTQHLCVAPTFISMRGVMSLFCKVIFFAGSGWKTAKFIPELWRWLNGIKEGVKLNHQTNCHNYLALHTFALIPLPSLSLSLSLCHSHPQSVNLYVEDYKSN